ncbi:MAG: hypothetical protein MI923_07105 [Phycisphaerales bacterium]|nr:hypothetical protein [Phycisphaerales bacterium]
MTGTHASPSDSSFSAVAADILGEYQAAIRDLLFGVGLEGMRPIDIGRELGVDKTLAWRVSRFAGGDDPLVAARHMPGPGGVRNLLEAAANRGVSEERITSVREADAKFREFVQSRAGDLRTFEAILAGTAYDTKAEFEQRRSYFQFGAAIWGVRASAQFGMFALCPSDREDGFLDVVQISGFVELERLKPDTPWIVRRLTTTTDDGGKQYSFSREPLDPKGVTGPGALPLLREFCSDPLPTIQQFLGPDGITYDEIEPGALGLNGAVTVITGEHFRAAIPSIRSEENRVGCYKIAIRTPVKLAHFDMLIHKDITNFGHMAMGINGLLEGRPNAATNPARLQQLDHELTPAKHLGSPPVLKNPRLTIYESTATRALALAGYNAKDFRGYRAEIEYPAAPTEIVLACELQ